MHAYVTIHMLLAESLGLLGFSDVSLSFVVMETRETPIARLTNITTEVMSTTLGVREWVIFCCNHSNRLIVAHRACHMHVSFDAYAR